MSDIDALLRAIVERPAEASETWLVLADMLEERADPRHELIRLQHQPSFRADLDARARQSRIVELLVGGMRPCVPRWTNAIGMRFVWCPPGRFRMGSPAKEERRDSDETMHNVRLTRGFWLAEAPVTFAQWYEIMREEPAVSPLTRQPTRPAEDLAWDECVSFCATLRGRDGHEYRLPTEAEWEYACRAGTTTRFFYGDTLSTDLANYDGNYTCGGGREGTYFQRSMPVRSYPPNVWGLYEMHGNIAEWVSDWLGPFTRKGATDPTGPPTGDRKVLRGGSWYLYPWNCRSANRNSNTPNTRNNNAGVRPCFFAEGHP